MNKSVSKICLTAFALAFGAGASAETRIVEVWNCTLRDGKTIEQVQQANMKWVEFANKQVQGGGIESYTMRPIVGNMEHFTFADSYPDMAAWTASKAVFRTPAGQAVEEALNAIGECTGNSLYESVRQ